MKDILTDIFGKTIIIQHKVHSDDDRSIRCKPYALSCAAREIQMIDTGIAREFDSSYASPMVIVMRKDGSNRIRVNCRKLNRITITDPEPMTSAEKLFQKLLQCQFFSKIDLSKCYWQIPVADEGIYKMAFVTGDGGTMNS